MHTDLHQRFIHLKIHGNIHAHKVHFFTYYYKYMNIYIINK